MKKSLLILVLISLLTGCSREGEEPNHLPPWLVEKITSDEKEIAADPDTYRTLGAWIQYRYKRSVYFEYHNLIFSSMPKVFYYDGSEMNFALPVYSDYQKGKCCKEIVWKGNAYFGN